MFSVIEVAGHQYNVRPGDVIDVQKLEAEVGSTIELDRVLLVGGEKTLVGAPLVQGAKVSAKVVRTDRDRKVIVFKRRPGGYKRKKGHRQNYTCLFITAIDNGSGKVEKVPADHKFAQKYLA
jgi:large subunit ribosomal protein L21